MTKVKANSENISKNFIIGFGILVLILGFLIEKEVSLPQPVTLSVAVVGGTVLLISSFFNAEIPLYALAAYVPFNRVLSGNFGRAMTALNLTNFLCIVAILGYIGRATRGKEPPHKSALNLPIFLFAVIGAVSFIRGGLEYGEWYFTRFLIPLKRWLTPLLLYFITLFIVKDRRTLKTVVVILMFAVTVAGLMAVKDYMDVGTVGSIEKERVGGIAEQPNMLAAFFCYYMFLFGSFYLCNASKPKYWLLLIPFLICFRGIQVTFSRGGYLAFFTGAFALSFFRSKILFVLTIVLLIIGIMNPILLPGGIVYRLRSTFVHTEEMETADLEAAAPDTYKGEAVVLEGSSRGRLVIWKGALKMIADHPFWGIGYGTFTALIPYYAPELRGMRMDAHNSYLIIAAEMGIPALLIFLWILGVAIWKTHWLYRHAREPFHRALALGFLAGLFALLMANMFGSRMHSEEISGYFWILCGLIVKAIYFEKEAKPLPVSAVSKGKNRKNGAEAEPVTPQSLSARLSKFDASKYGEDR